jgi:hypothetical protein
MKFNEGRGQGISKTGFHFDLDGGRERGAAYIVRAGKDPVRLPESLEIVDLLKRCLCTVKLGYNCYVVTNVYGDERDVPYGATLDEWQSTCEDLLRIAMERDDE